jgi:predicted membrane-bound spermidine synthase
VSSISRSRGELVGLLLLLSGFCSLAYEVLWFRYLRLVFGASTPATAVVTAIFMAGLGFGGLWWGRRADRHPNPLALYARLELGIALAALASPWLVDLVRQVYGTLGGTPRLGMLGGTLVRVALSTLVLGLPTFLMGGTLPAAIRACDRAGDSGRRTVGALYAANTLGAVGGVLVPTLWSLEALGLRLSLWTACWLNLLVAAAAGWLALGVVRTATEEEGEASAGERAVPIGLTLTAATAVGFVFFLLELVWYRMLAPLLGGSSYTFGILLALVLLGIGIGGALYARGDRARSPTATSFAGTCALESLLVAVPLALGDRLAFLAHVLRDLQAGGFWGSVAGWMAVTAIVVLGPAVVAGYQFPLLVALLGRGRRRLGRDVGRAYAWNTLGAIAGSLAGGLGALPLLGAVAAWRLSAATLVGLAVLFLLHARSRAPLRALARPALLGLASLALLATTGPTAFWRHSPIGAGRLELEENGPRPLDQAIRAKNRTILWSEDGVESSLAAQALDEYSFLVNGKADGSARTDAPTQVLGGLIGAALHPGPRAALVIGLGTGSTAGWLARVPGMERVDVVEIEPAVLRVAADCALVNHDVLRNPKVTVLAGDGREVLQTARTSYDIVFSEPSNPYRAGIASLFSEEFYRSVRDRLAPRGLLLQWLQGYEVDSQVIRTAYATLRAVFPVVESWEVGRNDLLLVASAQRIPHDVGRLREVVAASPWREALAGVWGVAGLEGLYAGYVATGGLADAVAVAEQGRVNTDDRPILEFGFARNLGRVGLFDIAALRSLALRGDHALPPLVEAALDPIALVDARMARVVALQGVPTRIDDAPTALASRIEARRAFRVDDLGSACLHWSLQPQAPSLPVDLLLLAECRAAAGDDQALGPIAALAGSRPSDARFARAAWEAARGDWAAAGMRLAAGFRGLRGDPWVFPATLRRALDRAVRVAAEDPVAGRRLYDLLREPLPLYLEEERRRRTALDLALALDFEGLCAEALRPYEPWAPWDRRLLAARVDCYRANRSPLLRRALDDLERLRRSAPPELDAGIQGGRGDRPPAGRAPGR